MSPQLSYFYHWHKLTDELYPRIAREFLDNGIDRIVFTDPMIKRALRDEDYLNMLRHLRGDLHLTFAPMHAPYGPEFDLNIPSPERRPGMITDHIRAMEIAHESGARTYTIHIGAYHYCNEHIPVAELRPNALRTLEALIPEAERLGIVIAVENSFEKTNSAHEVLDLIQHFSGCNSLGVCYDAGHANCMASAAWKQPDGYPDYQRSNWWEGFVTEDHAIDLLHPHIVTCHLHDNDGYRDLHAMPGDGTVNWDDLMPRLRSCPRMLEFQTEVEMWGGVNWAGLSPAPAGGYSIRRLADTFRTLGF